MRFLRQVVYYIGVLSCGVLLGSHHLVFLFGVFGGAALFAVNRWAEDAER